MKPLQDPLPLHAMRVRLAGLALLEAIVHGINRNTQITQAKTDARLGVFCAGYDDAGGSYASFSMREGHGALLCGGTSEDPRYWERGPLIEQVARSRIARLPMPVATLVEREVPKSLGWTFAMHAAVGAGEWSDLTGADPRCLAASLMRGSEYFVGDDHAACDRVCEEWGWLPASRAAVLSVLRGEPLTTALARGLLRERSIEEVVRDSASIGYPVSRELASGG